MLQADSKTHPVPTTRPTRRGRRLISAALAAVLGIGGAYVANAAEPGTATISGAVTDVTTGEPLAGAAVRDPDSLESTFTAEDGTYTLVVAPGEHRVAVAASGYEPGRYVDASGSTPTEVLTLTDGQDLADIDVALAAYASASGVVTSAEGSEPVAGVTVKLFPSGDPVASPTATTQTDSTGLWSVSELPAGTYVIQFDASDTAYLSRWWEDSPNRDEATIVDFTPGQSQTGLNMALVRGATISGHVQDEAGNPIPDAFVTAFDEHRGYLGNYGGTDTAGNFTLRGLTAGQYTLEFQAQDFVRWSYGMTESGEKPVYFSVPEGADVTGKTMILPLGATLAGRLTAASPISGGYLEAWASSNVSSGSATADPEGNYVIKGLDTGSYRVHFAGSGQQTEYWQDASSWETATLVDVVRGQAYTGFDAELAPEQDPVPLDATVAGRVVDTADAPVAGARIELDCLERGWYSAWSADDGTFSVAVPAGDCKATVSHSGGLLMKAVWRSPDGSDTFTASTGETFDLGSIELAEGVRLSGTVTGGGTGTLPLADVTVVAVPVDTPTWQYWSDFQTQTGPDGSFVLGGLPPDLYTLHYIAPASSGYGERWWTDAVSRSLSDYVVLPPGSSREGMDMRLSRVGSISGTVTTSDGAVLPGVRVGAMRADDEAFASVTSDPDGRFTIGGLPAGTYTLQFDAINVGFDSAWWSDSDPAGSPDLEGATSIVLDAGAAVTARDVSLRRAASVSGSIVSPEGEGIAEVGVHLGTADGELVYSTVTDAAGSYSIVGVGAGTYVLSFEPYGQGGFLGEFWDDAQTPDLATPLEVGAGQAVTASASLARGATISGRVSTPAGGPTPEWLSVYVARSAEPELVIGATSPEADGTWTVTGLLAGTYLVRAESDVYVPSWWADGQAVRSATSAAPIDVALGASRSGVDIELLPGAEIKGTLTDTAGAPLAGWVSAYDLDRRGTVRSSVADESGAFHIRGLQPGRYALRAQADGHEVRWYANAEVWVDSTVIALGETESRTLTMSLPVLADPPGEPSLRGQVTLPQGSTSSFDQLTVNLESLGVWDGTSVDSSGGFEFRGLPAGTYELTLQDMTQELAPVRVSVDLPTTQLLSVPMVVGGRVTGTVVNEAGKPIEATVHVIDAYGIEHVGYGLQPFLVTGLPTGPARVRVEVPYPYVSTWIGGSDVPGSGTPVDVIVGQTVELPLTVAVLGGSVSGRVTWPPNPDIWEVAVEAVNADGEVVARTSAWSDYPYQLDGLPPGPVKIRFSGQGVKTQWWQNAETEALATPVTIVAGRTIQHVDAALTIEPTAPPGTATLSGTVTVLGEPFAGAYVAVIDDQDRYAGSVMTDELGRYEFTALSAGIYRLRVDACLDSGGGGGRIVPQGGGGGDACVNTWWPSVSEAEASPIEVAEGAALTGFDVSIVASSLPALDPAPTPTISGVAQVGQVLTANSGTWGPSGVTLAYQWLRDGAPIGGATNGTYTVAPEDVGATVAVAVTGSLEGYTSTTRTSAATGAVVPGALTSTPTPTITGVVEVGQTVTAVPGTWAPEPVVLSYQWKRAGVPIEGATMSAYDIVAEDAGSSLSVEVTGSKAGYLSVTRTSDPTAAIPLQVLSPTPRPTISGTTRVGELLTASAGEWGPGDVQLAYQWLRGGQPIPGANGSSYELQPADEGARIAVQVTGSRTGYASVTQTSANTKAIGLGLLTPTPQPVISGSPVVGQSLVAEPGVWGPGEVSLTYQWYWAGKKIAGATSATYELTAADQGKRLVVRVTGTKPGYAPVTTSSDRTATVEPTP